MSLAATRKILEEARQPDSSYGTRISAAEIDEAYRATSTRPAPATLDMFEHLSDDNLTAGARSKRTRILKRMRAARRTGAPGSQRLGAQLWLNAAGWPIASAARRIASAARPIARSARSEDAR